MARKKAEKAEHKEEKALEETAEGKISEDKKQEKHDKSAKEHEKHEKKEHEKSEKKEHDKSAKEHAKKEEVPVQPEINIGLIGHVDHGKTTLTQRLSGKWTDTHSEELKRGITIRLGYANTTFYKCEKCKGPDAYSLSAKCEKCGGHAKVLRKVSFVDAPGHESLMATMLCGATIMDGALLLVAANEECPQPQTREHLTALSIMGIKHLVIVQNKIDLATKEQALKNYKQIKDFLKDTEYKDAPIIPISAQHKVNIDLLMMAIDENIKTPKRDLKKEPIMLIARSFDVNKPGTAIDKINGGVLGGAITQGAFKIGDDIEISPGFEREENNQKVWYRLKTKVLGLMTGNEKIDEAGPGGSVAVMTDLDPAIVKSDILTGQIVTKPGKGFKVYNILELEVNLLKRVVGSKADLEVVPIKLGEILMLNVNAAATVGTVVELKKNGAVCKLKKPVSAEPGARVTISRLIGSRFRLIGFGIIRK